MSDSIADLHPTERFSERVEHYVKARPGYPPALLTFLRDELGLRPEHRLADVGSGTGLLSKLLLDNGNAVVGVEPNAEMRRAGEVFLRSQPRFTSMDASAEATTLADQSVDFIFAGQAFHWFDPLPTRAEFSRILRPGGWVALAWNERVANPSGFDAAYEDIVRQFSIGAFVDHHRSVTSSRERLAAFFGAGGCAVRELANYQLLDGDGVAARVLSSSYMPLPGHAWFEPMMAQIEKAFAAHAVGGWVRLAYDTRVYHGRLNPRSV